MINLVKLLGHTLVRMLFLILLMAWLNKVNIVVMWWKDILKQTCDDWKEDDKDFENSTKC